MDTLVTQSGPVGSGAPVGRPEWHGGAGVAGVRRQLGRTRLVAVALGVAATVAGLWGMSTSERYEIAAEQRDTALQAQVALQTAVDEVCPLRQVYIAGGVPHVWVSGVAGEQARLPIPDRNGVWVQVQQSGGDGGWAWIKEDADGMPQVGAQGQPGEWVVASGAWCGRGWPSVDSEPAPVR